MAEQPKDFELMIAQAQNAYNQSQLSPDEEVRANGAREYYVALMQITTASNMKTEVVDKVQQELSKLVVTTKDEKLKKIAAAADHQLNLIKSLNDEQRTLLSKEADKKFNSEYNFRDQTIRMLGMANSIAAILQAFSCDTSGFRSSCEALMKEEMRKMPNMNLARVREAPTVVDPTGAVAMIATQNAAAQRALTDSTNELVNQLRQVRDAASAGAQTSPTTTQPPQQPPSLAAVDSARVGEALRLLKGQASSITTAPEVQRLSQADRLELAKQLEQISMRDGQAGLTVEEAEDFREITRDVLKNATHSTQNGAPAPAANADQFLKELNLA